VLFTKKERQIVRVLIVEDEPLVAFDTEHFLISEGYEIVATVESVEHALVVLGEAEGVDLVLVDVNLSDGSGVDVARAAHARGLAVLFVTGECPGEARALAVGCLGKPYPQRDLLAAIRAIDRVIGGGKPPKRLPGSFSLFLEPAAT
jgi:DNA-binding response OmpR family regulator